MADLLNSLLILFVFATNVDQVTAGWPSTGNDLIRNQDQISFPVPPELQEISYTTAPPPMRACPDYESSCGSVRRGPSAICFCDAMCSLRDDCCRDYRPYKREDHLSRRRILGYMQCSPPNRFGIPSSKSMLRQCPREYENVMIRAQCERPDETDRLLSWPVSGKYNGLLYRNIYCAICWDESKHLFWKFRTHCKGSVPAMPGATPDPNLNFQDILRACQVSYVSPFIDQANLRKCDQVYTSTCPRHVASEEASRCALGKTEIVEAFNDILAQLVRYKNQDCALCNGVQYEDILCVPDQPQGLDTPWGDRNNVGLSVLFDMNSLSVQNEGLWTSGFEGMNMTCPKDQIFDLFSTECRTIVCSENEIYHARKCHPDNSTFMPDCPTVLVPAQEFTELENGSIHIKGTITYLNSTEYHRFNESVLICKDSIIYDNISLYKLTGVLTTIGYSISCVSLLILLVVYFMIPKLRNVPGKVTMGLAFSLFWAQLLFLVGIERNEIRVVCAAFAVLIHYFYLSAFAWMFLLSLDLTLTFRPGNTRSIMVRHQSNRFLKYALYAFLMPGFVVILGIVLDFIPSASPYNPAYGVRQCWFSNQLSLLLLFLLPVSVHIISNIVMFVYTVYNVCKATQAVQMVRPVDECRIFLYLKLSVIMGTSWILVYAWLLTHESVLEILFIVFNSLQGLFICLSFVCRPKTYSLLKNRITGREVSHESTPTTKRTSMSANDKSASLLRAGRKSKQDLWIEMHGDPMSSTPLNGEKRRTAV